MEVDGRLMEEEWVGRVLIRDREGRGTGEVE